MKIGMHIILCMHTVLLQMLPCVQGNLQELGMCIFHASALGAPHLGFAHAVQYTHLYLACILTNCAVCSQLQNVL